MTRLPRETELDVLLGREPSEVGEGRRLQAPRRACRGSFRAANRTKALRILAKMEEVLIEDLQARTRRGNHRESCQLLMR
jgi:hypothetical protein